MDTVCELVCLLEQVHWPVICPPGVSPLCFHAGTVQMQRPRHIINQQYHIIRNICLKAVYTV